MRVIRSEAHRRISWLIADKSFRRKFIGSLARGIGTLPVARAMDNLKPGTGTVYLPDPVNEPTLLRGIGTNFEAPGFETERTIALPTINGTSHSTAIAEIRGAEELVLKKPFKHRDALSQLTGRRDIDKSGNSRAMRPTRIQASRAPSSRSHHMWTKPQYTRRFSQD